MADGISSAERWVNEVNAFAKQRESTVNGAKVRVLVPGVYNGPDNKSLGWCEKDQIICVAIGPYVESLISDGFVTMDLDVTPKRVVRKRASRKRRTSEKR